MFNDNCQKRENIVLMTKNQWEKEGQGIYTYKERY